MPLRWGMSKPRLWKKGITSPQGPWNRMRPAADSTSSEPIHGRPQNKLQVAAAWQASNLAGRSGRGLAAASPRQAAAQQPCLGMLSGARLHAAKQTALAHGHRQSASQPARLA